MTNFELNAQQPTEAIIRLNLAKTENTEKFGGRIWTGEKGDGRFAVLGTVVTTSNLTFRGREIAPASIQDAQVEVRLTDEDKVSLLEALETIVGRVAEIHITLTGEIAMKKLTLQTGETVNSIVFVAALNGVRQGSGALSSDEFATEDELNDFLAEAQAKTRNSQSNYRAEMQAARQGAPVPSANIMA